MKWVTTTENDKWVINTNYSDMVGDELFIGEDVGKTLYGFGCCISEICVQAIRGLGAEKQEEIFKELFSDEGCGF